MLILWCDFEGDIDFDSLTAVFEHHRRPRPERETNHRHSLATPSEPLSASTVWGIIEELTLVWEAISGIHNNIMRLYLSISVRIYLGALYECIECHMERFGNVGISRASSDAMLSFSTN